MRLVYDPGLKTPMTWSAGVSGSGTNFLRLLEEQQRLESAGAKHYGRALSMFTDRPDCKGAGKARSQGIPVASIDPAFLAPFSSGRKVGFHSPLRVAYDAVTVHEMELFGAPDIVCLAGYERIVSRFFIGRYPNRILNIHPGDTTKNYVGAAEVAIGDAILAEEDDARSTLFFVDESTDKGPVLVQSSPIPIFTKENTEDLEQVLEFASEEGIANMKDFKQRARIDPSVSAQLQSFLTVISDDVQERMKRGGDWPAYKFGVHHLLAQGRVAVEGSDVYVDGCRLPKHGFRLDDHLNEFARSRIVVDV